MTFLCFDIFNLSAEILNRSESASSELFSKLSTLNMHFFSWIFSLSRFLRDFILNFWFEFITTCRFNTQPKTEVFRRKKNSLQLFSTYDYVLCKGGDWAFVYVCQYLFTYHLNDNQKSSIARKRFITIYVRVQDAMLSDCEIKWVFWKFFCSASSHLHIFFYKKQLNESDLAIVVNRSVSIVLQYFFYDVNLELKNVAATDGQNAIRVHKSLGVSVSRWFALRKPVKVTQRNFWSYSPVGLEAHLWGGSTALKFQK